MSAGETARRMTRLKLDAYRLAIEKRVLARTRLDAARTTVVSLGYAGELEAARAAELFARRDLEQAFDMACGALEALASLGATPDDLTPPAAPRGEPEWIEGVHRGR